MTVACVWVDGHVPFGAEYVSKLYAMARRFLSRPFRFVCVTDRGFMLPADIEIIEVPSPLRGIKGWWSKIALFHPRHGLTGRVLYLDLDTLVVGPLDAIADYPAPFALVPHAGTFNGKGRQRVVKRFNSSVMVWDVSDATARIARDWTPRVTRSLWGDQDWIGTVCPEAATMPAAWFPRLSEFPWPDIPADAKVVLAKKPKNADAVKSLAGFAEAWG